MATVKDPVCGKLIESESAIARVEMAGQVFYFCSSECATTFEASPERYVSEARGASESTDEQLEKHEPPYTTLGFLTSPKFGAAGSGGLEYERLPEAHDR
jgi:YHS domain-containing protein